MVKLRGVLTIPLAVILAWSTMAAVAAAQPAQPAQPVQSVFIDDQEVTLDQPPVIMAGQVFIPLRSVFEKLGASVEWDPDLRHAFIVTSNYDVIGVEAGSRIAYVNGEDVEMDAPTALIEDHLYVPLWFLTQALDMRVEWREEASAVMIWTRAGAESGTSTEATEDQ